MGIYIKDMDMPTSCEDCPMCHSNAEYDYAYCCVSSAETSGNKIPSDCPLVPVPPHGDLIDRDALPIVHGVFMPLVGGNRVGCPVDAVFADEIADAPTIIEAEVEDDNG